MSDKQRLQVNNTNLSDILLEIGDLPLKALVEAAAREGQYVWKKLTAEGGTFVDYVVNDSETAYPDGGMQDGYWYERVSEGVDLLTPTGLTKLSVDKFTLSSDQATDSDRINRGVTINHSLGVAPRMAFLFSTINRSFTNYHTWVIAGKPGVGDPYAEYWYNGALNVGTTPAFTSPTATTVNVAGAGKYLTGGVEYTLVTMA